MKAADVMSIHLGLEARDIRIWIDGGWSVDALLGRQTRSHDDLDLVVETADLTGLQDFLDAMGYVPVERDDTRPWNFVLGDPSGRLIDIHVISLNADGSGQYGPPELGDAYPAGSLNGRGSIGGCAVRCIAAEYLVAFHTGYTPRASDIHDVALLCATFGIPLPDGYSGLVARDAAPRAAQPDELTPETK